MIRDVVTSLKDIAVNLKETQKPAKNDVDVNVQVLLQALQQSSEIKSELNSIKTLLLANILRGGNTTANSTDALNTHDLTELLSNLTKTSGNILSGQSTLATTENKNEAVIEEESKTLDENEFKRDRGIQLCREALASMVSNSENDEILLAGCNMLLMFLKNILKEPLNPRYRRVTRANQNFKKSLEPLDGHLKFFGSVGFEERGLQLELMQEWVESLEKSSDDSIEGWAKSILEDAIANLETVREQKSVYVASESTNIQTKPTQLPLPPSTASPAPNEKWQHPQHKVPQQNQFQDHPNTLTSSPEKSDQKANIPVSPEDLAQSSPTYPTSFAEVVRLQQEGKKPAGIKDIPDRLSSDAPSNPSLTPVQKPWEKVSSTSSFDQSSQSKVQIQDITEDS